MVERSKRPGARAVRVSGRLHAIDLEPGRIGIPATDGIDWLCRYTPELEQKLLALIGERVWVRGVGQLTGSQRGSLEIEHVEPIAPFEQSELFTYERVPLATLLSEQQIEGPTELEALAFRTR